VAAPPAGTRPRASILAALDSGERRLSARPLLLVFLLAFAVRSLYAVDLGPFMYRPQQPGTRMIARYDDVAVRIMNGGGILYPTNPDPARTGLLARPPGYPLYLVAIYRILGRDLFAVQLVQNALTSFCCVLLALCAARVVSARVGLLAGLVAALSPHLGFASNLLLPDALSALPLLVALLLLARSHPDHRGGWSWIAAGAVLGAGAWLRPNVVLLPGFLALVLVLLSRSRKRALLWAAGLVAAAGAMIIPITIRNWIVFHEFVPISTNGGLTFWQGVADAGGRDVGAYRRDRLVAAEEAQRYGKPEYADWWAEPDGIWRDHERYRRGWEVIGAHPAAFARTMLHRMAGMVAYDSGLAAPIALPGEHPPRLTIGSDGEIETPAQARQQQRAGERFLLPGRALAWLRYPLRGLQVALIITLLPLVLVGCALLLYADVRAAVLLLALPAYYFLTESFFILEWRVVVPMHYGLFVGAAVATVVGARLIMDAVRSLRARRRAA
jgi:4-amino-4-deoxy-L-arabinose transferase-like glycosyltransferase